MSQKAEPLNTGSAPVPDTQQAKSTAEVLQKTPEVRAVEEQSDSKVDSSSQALHSEIILYKNQQFKRLPASPDGNCFYHAVAEQLKRAGKTNGIGVEYTHQYLRWLAAASCNTSALLATLEVVLPGLQDPVAVKQITTVQEYVQFHHKNGTWADHGTIQALAESLNLHLVIYRPDASNLSNCIDYIENIYPLSQKDEKPTVINLYYTGSHYDGLEPLTFSSQDVGLEISPKSTVSESAQKLEPAAQTVAMIDTAELNRQKTEIEKCLQVLREELSGLETQLSAQHVYTTYLERAKWGNIPISTHQWKNYAKEKKILARILNEDPSTIQMIKDDLEFCKVNASRQSDLETWETHLNLIQNAFKCFDFEGCIKILAQSYADKKHFDSLCMIFSSEAVRNAKKSSWTM